jgi:hypothetical protein
LDYELHIISNSERKKYFKNCVAGGYCGHTILGENWIDIFEEPDYPNCEDDVIEILNHEVLHLVLGEVEGRKVKRKLDNIQKVVWDIDWATNTIRHRIEFIFKKRKHIRIV